MDVKTIKFGNFSGYLNNLSYYAGYGGMDWNDMYEIQSAFVNEHSWCDTGYNNVLQGQGEAITLGTGGFQEDNLDRTFNLVGGTFASAWESHQPVTFNSYTYSAGQGFSLKASVEISIGQNAKTINFAKYGSDFKHIAEVTFVSGVGKGGNTCSYGTPTYGYILVMDNLQVQWNWGASGHAHSPRHTQLPPHQMRHALPHIAANMAPIGTHDGHDSTSMNPGHANADQNTGYHSQMLSFDGHGGGGLTSQFALPQVEHFGT
jgi:hypothetical protein